MMSAKPSRHRYLDVVAEAGRSSAVVQSSLLYIQVLERQTDPLRRGDADHPVTAARVRVQARVVGTRQRPTGRRQVSAALCNATRRHQISPRRLGASPRWVTRPGDSGVQARVVGTRQRPTGRRQVSAALCNATSRHQTSPPGLGASPRWVTRSSDSGV